MAMLTPAQNPRGLARMIFTDTTLLVALLVPAPDHPTKHGPGNGIATRRGWRCAVVKLSAVGRAYLNSTLLTVTIFLPPSSATVPVTEPSIGLVQIFLWLALPLFSSK